MKNSLACFNFLPGVIGKTKTLSKYVSLNNVGVEKNHACMLSEYLLCSL